MEDGVKKDPCKEEKEWKRFMAGDQWTPEERKILEERKQPALAINRIKEGAEA